MSNCSNCFNGCTEIVSDRCVRYTGIDVPALGIQTGDTLSHVESSIIDFLVPVLTGVGIKPEIPIENFCELVSQYLPTCTSCTGFTLNDVLNAIIHAACNLQEQIDAIDATLATLNADYTLPADCLTGVTSSSDTHAILQAVINKLCSLDSQFTQLLIDLPNTYVSFNEINDIIQTYINDNTNVDSISSKMVPYAVLPYFGPIAGIFDSTGAGLNLVPTGGQDWTKVYLCNGNNSTPDLRGWALVGAIAGVPGLGMSPVVDPGANPANPNYSLGDTAGANQVTLTSTQIPLHTHANTAVTTITPATHNHSYVKTDNPDAGDGGSNGVNIGYIGVGDDKHIGGTLTNTGDVTLTAATVITNVAGPVGGGLPHSNIQPVKACYYIQYRP
jgi:microcystin-dependent protein